MLSGLCLQSEQGKRLAKNTDSLSTITYYFKPKGLFSEKPQRLSSLRLWPARRDLNPRSSESESAALSSCATGGSITEIIPQKAVVRKDFMSIFSIKISIEAVIQFLKLCRSLFYF